jgi:hypothetical protein
MSLLSVHMLALVALTITVHADDFVRWSARHAESVGQATYRTGRVGGAFDTRLLKTDRAYNYKLAATWITPDVIQATVRLQQLREAFDDTEARRRANAAIQRPSMVIMVEIDPREGSGVIPRDWIALLEIKNAAGRVLRTVPGKEVSELRSDTTFHGVRRRNYDYERLWVEFPRRGASEPSVPDAGAEISLVVRIYDKEGRVTWPIADAVRRWLGSDQERASRMGQRLDLGRRALP